MNQSPIQELQKWYRSQCDGEWEHQHGIKIETLDNPGWSVRVELKGTPLARKPFPSIKRLEDKRNWIHCEVVNDKFEGHGGPLMLEEIIRTFLSWANAPSNTTSSASD
ncbi:MAG: hypothetical protein RLZZ265_239 [Verrucomicrobiota bacterium]|jgi:hypothetical protein